jgi:hypothetical protein
MRIHTLVREQELHGTPGGVFALFADARNLESITPPLLRFRVVIPGTSRCASERSSPTGCGCTACRCRG